MTSLAVRPLVVPDRTANQRLKERFAPTLALALMAATVLHVLLFVLWPTMEVESWATGDGATQLIEPLDPYELPPPPDKLVRPAEPVFSADVEVDLAETVPIVDWEQARELPPPPADPEGQQMGGELFTPYTVAPTLLNNRQVERLMEREYPSTLKDAGLGGTVTLLIHVGSAGEVLETRIDEGSGSRSLDTAALRVAEAMRFRPALNFDKTVAVWIKLPLTFVPR